MSDCLYCNVLNDEPGKCLRDGCSKCCECGREIAKGMTMSKDDNPGHDPNALAALRGIQPVYETTKPKGDVMAVQMSSGQPQPTQPQIPPHQSHIARRGGDFAFTVGQGHPNGSFIWLLPPQQMKSGEVIPGREMMRVNSDGKIYVNGKEIDDDLVFYRAFRDWFDLATVARNQGGGK